MIDYTNIDISELIDNKIHSERDRLLIKRRLIDGIKQNELADEFELSVRQVQKIIYKCQDKLFK